MCEIRIQLHYFNKLEIIKNINEHCSVSKALELFFADDDLILDRVIGLFFIPMYMQNTLIILQILETLSDIFQLTIILSLDVTH